MISRTGALVGALILIAAWCLPAAGQDQKQAPQGPPPAPVRVAQVQERDVESQVTLTGNAEPHRILTVASRVEEVVAEGRVEEGDTVVADQVLLILDKNRIKVRLAEAQAVLREDMAELEQFKRDLARKDSLHQTNSVPLKELEDARTAVARQEALVDRNQEQIKLLRDDLADTEIKSPRAGIVVKRHAYKGEWVTKGGAILDLAVLDPVKVVVKVPERYLPNLTLGGKVLLTADALPGREIEGVIQAIIPMGDEKSRTFPVQVRAANPDGSVKPGMLMRATMGVGNLHKALLVPKDALTITPAGMMVYAVLEGKAAPIMVKRVGSHGDAAEVVGQLKPGMTVVVDGNERLRPGQPVWILEAKPQ